MTTNKASEKLRVDFDLIPFTALFVATLAFGIYARIAFLMATAAAGLVCVAAICVCEFYIRKVRREIDGGTR